MQISNGNICHYLNNYLPSQMYDLKSIQSIKINPWNTYKRSLSFYRILNNSNSAALGIFVSHFPSFLLQPHILPWGFTVIFSEGTYNGILQCSLRLSIIYQFNPNCILKALYCQISPKIKIWLHYPIILKMTWRKSCTNFWHGKIPGKVVISPELGRMCPL